MLQKVDILGFCFAESHLRIAKRSDDALNGEKMQ